MFELILFTSIFSGMSRIYNWNFEEFVQPLYVQIYPILIQIAMVLNSAMYIVALVSERECKIRYLLNFQGSSSTPYIVGMTFGDILLSMIPTTLLVIVGMLLQIQSFIDYWALLLLTLTTFSFSFIQLVNILATPWQTVKSAFTLVTVEVLIVFGIGLTL